MAEADMLQEKHVRKRQVGLSFLQAALDCQSQMAIVSYLLPQQLEKRQAENMTDCLAVSGYFYRISFAPRTCLWEVLHFTRHPV